MVNNSVPGNKIQIKTLNSYDASKCNIQQSAEIKLNVALGVTAVFVTQFISFLFVNARNIATPQINAEFDGMALFSGLIALPALAD